MIKVGITGACGRMGQNLREAVKSDPATEIGALIEMPGSSYISQDIDGVKVVDELSQVIDQIDVLIDFTTPEHTQKNLETCVSGKKAIVIGTTGLSDDFSVKAAEASKAIPVLVSSNMSIGVNALYEILKVGAKVLANYDTEIVEQHHRYKKDAPSGTALSIAKTILESRDQSTDLSGDHVVYERYGKDLAERKEGSLGIQTVRAGNIVGEHEVIFAANEEVIKVSHSAGSRMIFAMGGVKAAKFIGVKSPKLYKMSEVLGL